MLAALMRDLSAWRHREAFREVRAFVIFVGYPRSGHSLIGQCLNAHSDVVVAHERNVLKWMDGMTRDRLFAELLARDRWFAGDKGRQWMDWSYTIASPWQGRWRELRVIGDKAGGLTSRRLVLDPEALGRLQRLVGVPLRVIHHVRHPQDTIATMLRKGQPDLSADLSDGIRRYFDEHAAGVRIAMDRHEVLTIRHEEAVGNPRDALSRLAEFVNLEASAEWLDACQSLFLPSPHQSRAGVSWTSESLDALRAGMARYPWFAHYDVVQPVPALPDNSEQT